MGKDDWYRDRILWKVAKHKLLDKKCCMFSNLSNDKALSITEVIPEYTNPVIVFWESRDKWTVLGTRAICSFYDGNLVFSELDEINKQISLFRPVGVKPEVAKSESNFISLDKTGELVWVPAGAELFALMNILGMFPLGVPN